MKNDIIPVFFAANDKYASYLAVAMTSICFNTRSAVKFFIIDGGLTNESKEKLHLTGKKFNNIRIEFLKINDRNLVLKDFPDSGYISVDTYSRLFIPELVPKIDRAIYLDVDVIAMGDVKELYEHSIDIFPLGAVAEDLSDDTQKMRELKEKIYIGSGISSDHVYFNTGVLLINCNHWRKNRMLERMFIIEKETRKTRIFVDMDILNKCFEKNYYELPEKYNVMSFDEKTDIIIRHFGGPIKPWMHNTIGSGRALANYDDFWFYAKMTPFYEKLLEDYPRQSMRCRAYLAIKKKRYFDHGKYDLIQK
jgi:lipopolysaccharide biosynthesis glycosyltransferase